MINVRVRVSNKKHWNVVLNAKWDISVDVCFFSNKKKSFWFLGVCYT